MKPHPLIISFLVLWLTVNIFWLFNHYQSWLAVSILFMLLVILFSIAMKGITLPSGACKICEGLGVLDNSMPCTVCNGTGQQDEI